MIKKLWSYTAGYRKLILTCVVFAAVEAVLELVLPLIMADIVDIGIPAGDIDFIMKRGMEMVGVALLSMVLSIACTALTAKAGQGFGANLRKAQFEHIQSFSFRNIEKFSTSSLITRMTSDCTALQNTMMMSIRLMIRTPVMLVSALVLAMMISKTLSRVFFIIIPLLIILVLLILSKVSPLFGAMQERMDDVNLVVQENLLGIRVVKSFVREDYEKEKFAERNNALRFVSERAFSLVLLNTPMMMLMIYSAVIAVLWFGTPLVHSGEMEVGQITIFLTYMTQVLSSLMMVSMLMNGATRSIACGRRILEVLEEVPEIEDSGADEDLTVADGSVEFRHVWFQYHDESAQWNLKDIDFRIESGMTVGIIGATGSAKSTLVQLIPRLYEAQKGSIYVGGQPIQAYPLNKLRDAVAVVLQKNTLFSGTVRENLLWGNDHADQAQIDAACAAACVDEFIERLPDGYETELGQGGVNVSGGQKQRLCIARALLKNPRILILDDSTSAVDTATDANIRKALRTAMPETTKIIIAQRIVSVCDADLIIIMDDGRIAQMGTHEQLMETSEIYRDIYISQREGSGIDG